MKVKQIVCDICGEPIKYRKSIGYKIKKKRYFIDLTYNDMDICGRCMEKIFEEIRKEKES